MSPKARYSLLLGVVVLLGGVGAWRYSVAKEGSLEPDTAESATDWICQTCKNVTQLTARKAVEWSKDPERTRYGEQYDPKQTVYRCDDCDTFSVVRARLCKPHNEWWYRKGADGPPGVCPGCAKEAGLSP